MRSVTPVGLVRALMNGCRTAPDESIAVLLADVDGTLPGRDTAMTPRTVEAIMRLRERGVAFCVISRRPPLGLRMFVEPVRLTVAMAALGGGALVRPDLSVIDETTLPVEIPAHVIDICRAHRLEAWVYTAADWYVTDPQGLWVEREASSARFSPVLVPDFEDLYHAVIRIVGVSADHYAVERCEASVQAEFGRRVTTVRSRPHYLDVMSPEANTGAVVERLARYLRVSPRRIATIGDQPGDTLMFKESGLSVAMGSAGPDVRRRATFATASSGDEGFADAVERFILPRTHMLHA